MPKKKTSKKHGFSFDDMPQMGISDKRRLPAHDPSLFFQDMDKVGAALLECLLENDTEGFIEIFDAYLRVNRTRVAKQAKLSRSTVQLALSRQGNPTLKTLAKIAHESIAA